MKYKCYFGCKPKKRNEIELREVFPYAPKGLLVYVCKTHNFKRGKRDEKIHNVGDYSRKNK